MLCIIHLIREAPWLICIILASGRLCFVQAKHAYLGTFFVFQDVGLARILKREYLTTLQGSAFTFAYAAPEVRNTMLLRAHLHHSRPAQSREGLERGAAWQVLLGRECSTAVDCYGLGAPSVWQPLRMLTYPVAT